MAFLGEILGKVTVILIALLVATVLFGVYAIVGAVIIHAILIAVTAAWNLL